MSVISTLREKEREKRTEEKEREREETRENRQENMRTASRGEEDRVLTQYLFHKRSSSCVSNEDLK